MYCIRLHSYITYKLQVKKSSQVDSKNAQIPPKPGMYTVHIQYVAVLLKC